MYTLEHRSDDVIDLTVAGQITDDDYDRLIPQLEREIAHQGGLRILLDMTDMDGIEPIALWRDLESFPAKSGPSGVPGCAAAPRREADGILGVSRAPRNAGAVVQNGAPRRGGLRGEARAFDMKHRNDYERVAVVGDQRWHDWATRLFQPIAGGEVRYFDASERYAAERWIEQCTELPA